MGELSKQEDEWQRRAIAAAIAAARKIALGDEAVINKNAPIGRLSDVEWGWIVAAAIFAWIKTRAEQATAEELDTERMIRMTGLDPDPWDAGAVAAVLPKIANLKIDWDKPLAEWDRETMVTFLVAALKMIRGATIARDLSSRTITSRAEAVPVDDIPF